MTDIEQKALALVNEVRAELKLPHFGESLCGETFTALCRLIEQHEAFRREVSDALVEVRDDTDWDVHPKLWRFIIAKPDPLVEVLDEALWEVCNVKLTDRELRAVFLRLNAKRGGKIIFNEE